MTQESDNVFPALRPNKETVARLRRETMVKLVNERGPCTIRYLASKLRKQLGLTCNEVDTRKVAADARELQRNGKLCITKITDIRFGDTDSKARMHSQKVLIVSGKKQA